MPWVFIDDHFDEHPKFEAAGPEAIGLYVAGLCYANRNLTGGRIPKGKALRLVAGNTVRLAHRLVEDARCDGLFEAGLWEEAGDFYDIHDYVDHNASAEAKRAERSQRASKAAKHRWSNANADAQAMPEHPPGTTNDDADACAVGDATSIPPAGARAGEGFGYEQKKDAAEIERLINAELAVKANAGRTPDSIEGWKNWRRPQLEAERAETRRKALNGAKSYGESLVELEPSEARDLISSRFDDEDFRRSAFSAFNSSREQVMAKTRMP